MNIRKLTHRLAILLILAGSSQAAIHSLSGTIRNAQSLEPLPYANVIIRGTYLGTTSNVDGYFYLSGLDADTVIVVCSYIGFQDYVETLVAGEQSHVILPIALAPIALGGEEVVVEDSLVQSPEFVLTPLLPQAGEPAVEIQPLESSHENLPRFEVELASPMVWLPAADPGLQFVIDGVPVHPTRHLYGIYPAFNLEAVTMVAHHAPGTALQSGNAYREVTELVYREGNRARFDFQGNLGLVESGLTTSGPLAMGGSWYLSARRVDYDGIYSMASQRSDSVYTDFMPDYYFYDVNTKATLDLSDGTKASLTGYLTYDKLHWLGDQARSASSSWFSRFLSLRLHHRWNPRFATTANLYTVRNHAFLRANRIPLGHALELEGDLIHDASTLGLRTTTEWYLGRNNGFEIGLGMESLDHTLELGDTTAAGVPKPLVGIFDLNYHHLLPYSLRAEAGLQAISVNEPSDLALNPTLHLDWTPSNVYGAHVNLSRSVPYTRNISLSNTLNLPLFDVLLPLDASLPQTTILASSVGLDITPAVGIETGAEFFMEKIHDPVLMDSAWTGTLDRQSDWVLSYPEGSRSGIRAHVEKRTPGLHVRLSYRYQTGQLQDAQVRDIPLLGERDHELRTVFQGTLGEMGIRLETILASGRHYLDENDDPALSGFYHRIDLRFERRVRINRVNGKLRLELYNLTGASSKPLNTAVWSPLTAGERDYPLLPFLPNLQLEFTF